MGSAADLAAGASGYQFLNGKQLDGEDLYGILDVCARAADSIGTSLPVARPRTQSTRTTTPGFSIPGYENALHLQRAFVRAAQDIIDACHLTADQVNSNLNRNGIRAVSCRHRFDGPLVG